MKTISQWVEAMVRNRSFRTRLAAVILCLITSAAFAQVNRTIGTLPPGGTVTITFSVTINTNLPPNTSSVTNQGNVSGTGFGTILTDDPATGALNDPTITAITVAPKITCPADITTNLNPCLSVQPIAFAATVTAGVPPPTVIYKIGTNVITSPYVFPFGTNVVSVTATNGTLPNAFCSFTVMVLPATPLLKIVRTGTNMVVSWPTGFPCFTLQYAPILKSNGWSVYPGPYATNGGNIFATNSAAISNRFFRLIK